MQIGKIARPEEEGGGYYTRPGHPEDGRYISVTTAISRTTPKPFLSKAKTSLAVRYALGPEHERLSRLVALGGADEKAAIREAAEAADREWDRKARVGSFVHSVVEALVLDTAVPAGQPGHPLPTIPDDLYGQTIKYGDSDEITIDQEWLDTFTDGFTAFVADFDPEFIYAEATVANVTHRWAGTLDLMVRMRHRGRDIVVMVDVKTGKNLYPDNEEQVLTYPFAEEVWLDDLGNVEPMPVVDEVAILHIRPEFRRGYRLHHVPLRPQPYEDFLRRITLLRHVDEDRIRIAGRPIYPDLPDGTQPLPYVEDIDVPGSAYNRCRGKLVTAGIERVSDLAEYTRADVLGIKGIGEKSIDGIADVLAVYGLTFADERPAPVADAATVLAGVGA